MTNRRVSITFSRPNVERLERPRRKRGRTRNRSIPFAFEIDRTTADYVAGHLRVPEGAAEGKALLRVQIEGLEREDWA